MVIRAVVVLPAVQMIHVVVLVAVRAVDLELVGALSVPGCGGPGEGPKGPGGGRTSSDSGDAGPDGDIASTGSGLALSDPEL